MPFPPSASRATVARLRRERDRAQARRLDATDNGGPIDRLQFELVAAPNVRVGDLLLCIGGDVVAADGEILGGRGVVDESALVGGGTLAEESAVARSSVLAGSRVVSGWLVLRVTAAPGASLIDRAARG